MVCGISALAVGASAFGQSWSDDFESYNTVDPIEDQSDWEPWDDNPAGNSWVTTDQARSGTQSLEIVGASDTINQEFGGIQPIDTGLWRMTAWVYVPSDLVAPDDTYFILLNEYDHGGPQNWSTQVHFDPDTDSIIADFDEESLPVVYDEWVEIRVEINLCDDNGGEGQQDFFYNGELLYSDTWTERVSGGGQLAIGAIDLFAFGASSVYYDDVSLEKVGDCDCLEIEVDRLVGGLTSTFTITDPNGSDSVVALVYGFQEGQTQVNGQFGYCANFGIRGVSQNKVICQGAMSNGERTCRQFIPANAAGRRVLFQSAMRDTCPDPCMSNILDMTVQ